MVFFILSPQGQNIARLFQNKGQTYPILEQHEFIKTVVETVTHSSEQNNLCLLDINNQNEPIPEFISHLKTQLQNQLSTEKFATLKLIVLPPNNNQRFVIDAFFNGAGWVLAPPLTQNKIDKMLQHLRFESQVSGI